MPDLGGGEGELISKQSQLAKTLIPAYPQAPICVSERFV